MTVLTWPKSLPPKAARKLIVDPLPQSVLHQMVSDLPGPKDETPAEQAARFKVQLAEVLSYNPRNTADAMIATQCILLRLMAEDSHRDAARPNLNPAMAKKFLRGAKQADKLLADMRQALAHRQALPQGKLDPVLFASLGLDLFLIPDPDDHAPDDKADDAEEAFSAIIVPLHPAPKMLQ
jgi:hypothetical protein